MKVLFLCRRPFTEIVGGVAEFLNYLPIALRSLDVTSLGYTSIDDNAKTLSAPLYLANQMPMVTGPYLKPGLFSFSKKLRPLFDFCRQEKIDVVHAQGVYRSGYVAMQIYKNTGIPYILTSHSDILTTNSERMQRKKIQRRCHAILKNAAAVTHLTPLMERASQQIYDTHEKNVVIGNGIDLAEWKPFQHAEEKNYLLSIGRLEEGKGFHVLIDAFAELQKEGCRTSLVIAGDGAAKNALQEQVKARGLNLVTDVTDIDHFPENSVIFTGYIRGEAKKKLFAHSKIILFATQPQAWEEAFSIVQIEAMAAGKAMIASDTEPTRYFQSIGLQTELVEAQDRKAWAEKIKKLLENRERRAELCRENLKNVVNFDWNKVAEQYKAVYKAVSEP